jgi:phosphotransferase system HPr (HPr) family protein
MVERHITVTIINGLHARPAAEFVKKLRQFKSEIMINNVSAKSILHIMCASIKEGQTIHVVANGEDEQEAMQWMESFL